MIFYRYRPDWFRPGERGIAMYRRSLLSVLFLFSIAAQSFAQDSLNVRMVGRVLRYWDKSQDIAVQGDYAYVASGFTGFSIVDISDMENPVETAYFDTPAFARGVAVSGQYAYVAASESGMIVFDCSDPENPFIIGVCDTPGIANNVELVGDSAYVSDLQGGLRIIDISDPEDPVETAFCATADSTCDVAVAGRYAFMADTEHGLKVVNIDNMDEVFEIDRLFWQHNSNGIDIEGDFAYVTCAYYGIIVYDISDPENPAEIESINTECMENDIDVEGNYAYVAEGMWTGGIRIVDISDPGHLFCVNVLHHHGAGFAVTVSGDYAFLAGQNFGMTAVDISDPENPVEAGAYDPEGAINDVKFMDQYALVLVDSGQLHVIDINEPSNPEIVSTIQVYTSSCRLFVFDQYVFLTSEENGFFIYDFSDPENPFQIRYGCRTPGRARAMDVSGDYAFIADGRRGLQVADISDMRFPFISASCETAQNAVDIAISGNHAFIADRNLGLRSFDISDPENPQEISFFPMPGITDRLKIDGDIAYLTRSTQGICILDISDPANPIEISRLDTPGVAVDIDVVGNNVFIADDQEGVRIIDVTHPNFPFVSGYYNTFSRAIAVAANDDVLLVSDTQFLKIFDYSGVNRVPPLRTMNIPLSSNRYELVSTPLIPFTLESEAFFREVENLVIAYQDDGTYYLPRLVHNSLDEIEVTEGYQLYCDQPSSLPLVGRSIDPQTEYSLVSNRWNWLGYPFLEEVPMEVALQEIRDQVDILMNDDGRLWIPAWEINTLGTMKPGEGYYVAVLEDVTFRYHSDALLAATHQSDVWEIPEVKGAPISTGLPWVVLVTISDELRASGASTIELYDGELLVGKAAVLEDRELTPVPCWQGSVEHGIPGFTTGHPIIITACASDGTILVEQTPSVSFGEGPYALIDLSGDMGNDQEEGDEGFEVGEGYPSPFNPTLTIPFTLPYFGEVNFMVYDILGRTVYDQTRMYSAGSHRFEFNADLVNTQLASGVYMIKMTFGSKTINRKVMLVK